MAEVFVEYQTLVRAPAGRLYRARACGAEAQNGTARWHGWIEFVPVEGGEPIRTGCETTQPNREATIYWATGLTPVYLRGALDRALASARSLNPFTLFREGVPRLRKHLGRLSRKRLVEILNEYRVQAEDVENLERRSKSMLIDDIVAALRVRLNPPPGLALPRALKSDKTYTEILEHLTGGVSVANRRTISPEGTIVEKPPSGRQPRPKPPSKEDE